MAKKMSRLMFNGENTGGVGLEKRRIISRWVKSSRYFKFERGKTITQAFGIATNRNCLSSLHVKPHHVQSLPYIEDIDLMEPFHTGEESS